MSLLDVLRKLGIIRFGVKSATYKGGKDRPIEFMMDNVFDAKKDLIHNGDAVPAAAGDAAKASCGACGVTLRQNAKFCQACGVPAGEQGSPGVLAAEADSGGVQRGRKPGGCFWVAVVCGVFFLLLGVPFIAGVIADFKSGSSGEAGMTVTSVTGGEPDGDGPMVQGNAPAVPVPDRQPLPVPVEPPAVVERSVSEVQAGDTAAEGSSGVTADYALYVHPQWGFQMELPSGWAAHEQNNTLSFSGAPGTEAAQTVVTVRRVDRQERSTVRSEVLDLIGQWRRFSGYRKLKEAGIEIGGAEARRIEVEYRLEDQGVLRKDLVVVLRDPYFFHLDCTAPGSLMEKKPDVFERVLRTFRFRPVE